MGFFESVLTSVDGNVVDFVHGAFIQLSPLVQTLWRMMAIIMVALYGYTMMLKGNVEIREMFTKLLKMVMLLSLVTEWGYFTLGVYDMAVKLPSEIADLLISVKGETGGSINSAINDYFDSAAKIYGDLFNRASINSLSFIVYGGFVAIVTFLLGAYALFLLVLAKLAVAILLAVGPIFILLLITKQTNDLFMGWLRTLANYALIPLFVYTFMAFILLLLKDSIEGINDALQDNYAGLGTAVTAFCVTGLMALALCTQILGITTGITGGWALSTQGHAGGFARRTSSGIRTGFSTAGNAADAYARRKAADSEKIRRAILASRNVKVE